MNPSDAATDASDTPQAPQSLRLDARATAMLKAIGVHWRWPEPAAAGASATLSPPEQSGPVAGPTESRESGQVDATVAPSQTQSPHETDRRASDVSNHAPAGATMAAAAPSAPAGSPSSAPASVAAAALPPRHMALEGLHWEGLQQMAHSCQACGLSNGRVGHSWGQGSARARWLFVTPRLHPADTGEDTVQGDEAALLTSIWRAMGLTEADVFVTALTKCRAAMGLHASAADTAQCLNYLQHQVRWLQPDMIVAMGLPVAHALWGYSDAPLAQWRGQLHNWQHTPAVVTYPLDALLRRPIDKAKAWTDMCLALDHLHTSSKPT